MEPPVLYAYRCHHTEAPSECLGTPRAAIWEKENSKSPEVTPPPLCHRPQTPTPGQPGPGSGMSAASAPPRSSSWASPTRTSPAGRWTAAQRRMPTVVTVKEKASRVGPLPSSEAPKCPLYGTPPFPAAAMKKNNHTTSSSKENECRNDFVAPHLTNLVATRETFPSQALCFRKLQKFTTTANSNKEFRQQ